MSRLLTSFSFRLALLYAVLFTVSLSILLGSFYWISIHRPIESIEHEVEAEAHQYERLFAARGPQALAQALRVRAAEPGAASLAYHALIAADGHVLTTNLPSWPAASDARWLRIEADIYRDGDEDDHEALVLDLPLAGGMRMLIGRDIEEYDKIGDVIRNAMAWGVPAVLLLVIAGGALLSRSIGRQIEAMTAAAHRVMAGDLSGRIPERGNRDDMDRLAATLNAMLDRIEASLEAVRRVSDSVAHELRTPLARLQAELAELACAPPDRAPALVARAQEEAERLARMFDGVLRISGIEASRPRAALRPLDLSALVADAAEYHAPQAEERALTLETAIAPGIAVTGDPDLLFQAVSNLIDNAAKFTPRGGRIAVTLAREGGQALLGIADNGPGVPPELEGKLGERFFRAPGTEQVPGFGLGLALVTSVAALHGSEVRFADAGPGLRVEWRLPAGD
ncbi:sensor histidine kinase [Sphingomonas canadensis]|uniref:histidine kinase n=1 Tax=Sphingomonas canadensis TaxID=1219257 RepID=A0ABW3H885_9SPHN|nr:HAMP domain-containing sensor histidine kinase [Sphingomonas canadensis]MCW3834571.1 HAMP domain-containing histidine kinase [Sphingomonas canadensis]